MTFELFMMLEMLKRGCHVLENRGIKDITTNAERCRELVLNSVGIVTALNPIIGYEKSAEIAKQALEKGESVRDIVLDKGLVDRDKLEKILSVENLMQPKIFRE
jgi:aspartate ammonia-lyase